MPVPMIQIEGRSVVEWVGKHPDEPIPDYVRLRTFLRFKRICQLTGLTIRPGDNWDIDHIKRLKDGGSHRESNFQLVLRGAHQIKSASEQSEGAHIDRVIKRSYGITKPKGSIARKPKEQKTVRPPANGVPGLMRQYQDR